MLLHEALEKTLATLRIVRNILLQWGYRHSAHIDHCVGDGDRNAQSEPFDVTIKHPREKERGFQCRVYEIMLFDGNKNCSEIHGDLPFGSPSTPAAPGGSRACRSTQLPGVQ